MKPISCIAALLIFVCTALSATEWEHGWYWGFHDGLEQAYVRLDSWQGFDVAAPPRSRLLKWAEDRSITQRATDQKMFIEAYVRGFAQGFNAGRTGKVEK